MSMILLKKKLTVVKVERMADSAYLNQYAEVKLQLSSSQEPILDDTDLLMTIQSNKQHP